MLVRLGGCSLQQAAGASIQLVLHSAYACASALSVCSCQLAVCSCSKWALVGSKRRRVECWCLLSHAFPVHRCLAVQICLAVGFK
jgi:hypothetical protein